MNLEHESPLRAVFDWDVVVVVHEVLPLRLFGVVLLSVYRIPLMRQTALLHRPRPQALFPLPFVTVLTAFPHRLPL